MKLDFPTAVRSFARTQEPEHKAACWKVIQDDMRRSATDISARQVRQLFMGSLKEAPLHYFDQVCSFLQCKGCEKKQGDTPAIAQGISSVVSAFVRAACGKKTVWDTITRVDEALTDKARNRVIGLLDDVVYGMKVGELTPITFRRALKDFVLADDKSDDYMLGVQVKGALTNAALAHPEYAQRIVNQLVSDKEGKAMTFSLSTRPERVKQAVAVIRAVV